MNIGELVQSILAKLGGFDAKFEELKNSIAELKQANTSASADLQAKDTEIADLKAKLESAPKAEDISSLQAQLTEVKGKLTEAEAHAAKEPERFNAQLAQKLAEAGHDPLSEKKETAPGNENKELKGLAKVTAAFRSQLKK